MVEQYCNVANNSAQCASCTHQQRREHTVGAPRSGYTEPGGDGTPGTISVSSGYDQGTAVNTGGSLTAGMKLGKIISISIEQTYGHELAFDTNFTASEAIDVNPSDTGYIWGRVPVIQYTGTMKVVVGNTTWTITNMVLTSPDTPPTGITEHAGHGSGHHHRGHQHRRPHPGGATPLARDGASVRTALTIGVR